jgi:predicted amidohydrolase
MLLEEGENFEGFIIGPGLVDLHSILFAFTYIGCGCAV